MLTSLLNANHCSGRIRLARVRPDGCVGRLDFVPSTGVEVLGSELRQGKRRHLRGGYRYGVASVLVHMEEQHGTRRKRFCRAVFKALMAVKNAYLANLSQRNM